MNNQNLEHWSLLDELERKSMETAADLERRHKDGYISAESCREGLLSINGMTRGLIDAEISEEVDRMLGTIDGSAVESRVLEKNGTVLVFKRHYGADCYEISGDKFKQFDFEGEERAVEAARDAMNRQVEKLKTLGWRELL